MEKINKLMLSCLLMLFISISGIYATATVNSIYPTKSVSGCIPSFKINTTGDTEIYKNSTAKINITIWDMKCGLSHVRMKTEGINFKHNHSPEFFASAPPLETRTYRLNITIPEDAQTGDYPIDLTFTSNEHQFEKSITFRVIEKENEKESEPENLTEENETEETGAQKKENKLNFFSKFRNFFKNIFGF
ncbi:MAG: hypothetical protein R6U26_04145 [Candidatus Undinarchaeales archaeon]